MSLFFQILFLTIFNFQAASDSCSMMGNRKFLNQIIQDMCLEEQHGIQNETEISNMKEYMKV